VKGRQEAFNVAVEHLRKQGRPALKDYNCHYRTEEGNKCAIGALISDEFYSPDMEGWDATVPPVAEALRASGWDLDSTFALELQLLHDGQAWRWDLEKDAKSFAKSYNLQVPPE
jgi:hypothetical protein